MKTTRRAVHALIIILAVIPWFIGLLGFGLALLLVLLADRVWPDATMGNCWSFVGPRWFRHGGYILIRPADNVRVLNIGWIPHAIWVKSLSDGVELEQTHPDNRTAAKWIPWRTVYFPFKVLHRERPHPAKIDD